MNKKRSTIKKELKKPLLKNIKLREGYFAIEISEPSKLVTTDNFYKTNMKVVKSNCDDIAEGDIVYCFEDSPPLVIECEDMTIGILHMTQYYAVDTYHNA